MDIGTLKDVHTLEDALVLRYLGLEWVTLTGVALTRGSWQPVPSTSGTMWIHSGVGCQLAHYPTPLPTSTPHLFRGNCPTWLHASQAAQVYLHIAQCYLQPRDSLTRSPTGYYFEPGLRCYSHQYGMCLD